jgi:hypothetical protein
LDSFGTAGLCNMDINRAWINTATGISKFKRTRVYVMTNNTRINNGFKKSKNANNHRKQTKL